jgi:hypothetical protein
MIIYKILSRFVKIGTKYKIRKSKILKSIRKEQLMKLGEKQNNLTTKLQDIKTTSIFLSKILYKINKIKAKLTQ